MDRIDKEKLHKTISEIYGEPDSMMQKARQSFENREPVKEDYKHSEGYPYAMAKVKQKAVVKLFKTLSNKRLKGSSRKQRRTVEAWLDKNSVEILEQPDESFIVKSPNYVTHVVCEVLKQDGLLYYNLEVSNVVDLQGRSNAQI